MVASGNWYEGFGLTYVVRFLYIKITIMTKEPQIPDYQIFKDMNPGERRKLKEQVVDYALEKHYDRLNKEKWNKLAPLFENKLEKREKSMKMERRIKEWVLVILIIFLSIILPLLYISYT